MEGRGKFRSRSHPFQATVAGNWRWRFERHDLTKQIRQRLRTLTVLYDRGGTGAELAPEGGAGPSRAFEV